MKGNCHDGQILRAGNSWVGPHPSRAEVPPPLGGLARGAIGRQTIRYEGLRTHLHLWYGAINNNNKSVIITKRLGYDLFKKRRIEFDLRSCLSKSDSDSGKESELHKRTGHGGWTGEAGGQASS